ncbi:hypothetical protein TIFTF001_035414 [Ficus carica]|uniref:Uncharacterized protein n=1 Tax=Ficus carica TaxID=3494 RepID=A0AA88EAH1_FICCA|nr:hypothetical protein TIFTF001_035414 [Ficus carica]
MGTVSEQGPCVVVLCLIACKKEASRSKGDTSEVSAKGTPMFKLVSDTDEQAQKQSFGKENSPYLNEVVGVACCVTVLLSAGTGRHGRNSTGPTTKAEDQQYIKGGGRSTKFPRKNPQLVCLFWSGIHGHRLFSTDRENRSPLSTPGLIKVGVFVEVWLQSLRRSVCRLEMLIGVVLTRPSRC